MKPRILNWSDLSSEERSLALQRPAAATGELNEKVAGIIESVRRNGDEALIRLTQSLDQCELEGIRVSSERISEARDSCPDSVLAALCDAGKRIQAFHEFDLPVSGQVETVPGMVCETRYQPIDTVGLYVPGGTAPLVSTTLMLGIPANIAGCRKIVLCTPPGPDGTIANELLSAISLCEIDHVFSVGGAQAIAAMAFGTESVPRCDKIFGPGNAWVTEAKHQVSVSAQGAAIDLPAGPSEVLVIADQNADAETVAWDLLSQAEHGPDSQVILLTDDAEFARRTAASVSKLAPELPRAEVLGCSLESARIIVTGSIQEAVEISNAYAPEHLVINTRQARKVADSVRNAGSVFVGPWTPESLGDYCSGTNHVLPTYGWARSHSALSVTDFMRRYTVQEASAAALQRLGPTAEVLAAVEGLQAHRMAVRHRLNGLAAS